MSLFLRVHFLLFCFYVGVGVEHLILLSLLPQPGTFVALDGGIAERVVWLGFVRQSGLEEDLFLQ